MSEKKITVMIQARTGSSRLPGKVLSKIENKNMKTNFKKIELYYSVVELCRKFYGEEQEEFFDNQTRDE